MKRAIHIISNYKFMLSLLWRLQQKRIIAFPFIVFINAIEPFVPVIFSTLIINELAIYRNWDRTLIYIFVMCVSSFWLKFFKNVFDEYDIVWESYFAFNVVGEILKKYMSIDMADLDEPSIYNKYLMADKAINEGIGYFMNSLKSFFIGVVQFFVSVAIIFNLHPLIILIISLGILFSYTCEKQIFKNTYKFENDIIPNRRKYRYFEKITTNFDYGKEIRIYSLKDILSKNIYKNLSQYYNKYKEIAQKNLGLNLIIRIINVIQQVVIYFYMIYQFFACSITIGEFSLYLNATEKFKGSCNEIIEAILDINKMDIRIQDVRDFLEIESKLELTEIPGCAISDLHNDFSIEFRNVSFKYPHSNEFALRNVSITIPFGEKISIIGYNGAGKSTFIKLLIRLYDPTEGEILIGGRNIADFNLAQYHKLLGVVFQDFKIFSFTLKENLAFEMARDISDKEILNILENVELGDRIAEMEKGIYTYLFRNYEYDGIELSGGEMQRIAIARALLKDAPIVIMDEPTSSLDALAEAHIYEYFNKLVEGKTGIYISHRMSSTKFCDKIAYFEEGMIKEFGTLNELMTIRGGFYNMYKLQANYYSS